MAPRLDPDLPTLPGPLFDEAYLKEKYPNLIDSNSGVGPDWKKNPKSALANFMMHRLLEGAPEYRVQSGLLYGKRIMRPPGTGAPAEAQAEVKLSDGSKIGYERARQFMDYYCHRFEFGQPFVDFDEKHGQQSGWEAILTVGGRRIGIGIAKVKDDALQNSYLDVVQYLERCDSQLWKDFVAKESNDQFLQLPQGFISTLFR
ncbi:hypothetical protein DFH11DRAFT_1546166 [Phellopilus nigrolimitatus]|nr:hypothetical protein DFH11DRAFT_1546166 [Phellopilus nigrolimitatus]